ncbi:MAG: hypothetical protein Q9162_006041 [Coniocarpon cinnabarinum]
MYTAGATEEFARTEAQQLDRLTAAVQPLIHDFVAAGDGSALFPTQLEDNHADRTSPVHVYKVAPSLTIIEKAVGESLAKLFGFDGPRAGGVSQSGGSGANLTALVVARNNLFPETKDEGCARRNLVLFTSAHGHYSFEKAAQVCGLGAKAVRSVPVDSKGMSPKDLLRMIKECRAKGETPFFVNATAGTTVLGSFDPLEEIGLVCQQEGVWFHIDGSWGGPVVFSEKQRHKLQGARLAHTLTVNPHKMLGVPITCSFLLARDILQLHHANTLPAAYLFHTSESDAANADHGAENEEVWDLADLTLQCGRKGDALKMALSWVCQGSEGFSQQIEHGFSVAQHLTDLIASTAYLVLASQDPPPCLQVCFYYGEGGSLGSDTENSFRTRRIADMLVKHNFLVDYAPGDAGLFLRVVVSINTRHETVEALVRHIVEVGRTQDGACCAGAMYKAAVSDRAKCSDSKRHLRYNREAPVGLGIEA